MGDFLRHQAQKIHKCNRLLECALARTKAAVAAAFEKAPRTPEGVLKRKAALP
jgi:hypothetical protein